MDRSLFALTSQLLSWLYGKQFYLVSATVIEKETLRVTGLR